MKIKDIVAGAIVCLAERHVLDRGYTTCLTIRDAAVRLGAEWTTYGQSSAVHAWIDFCSSGMMGLPHWWGEHESFYQERVDKLNQWAAERGEDEV